MRALHVVCIDLEFGLGEELAVLVQEQRLADLVTVGLLRARLHEYLALEDAGGAVLRSTFLKTWRLSQATASWVTKIGIVVVERAVVAVAERRARDMRDRLVAGDIRSICIRSGSSDAVHRQGEALVDARLRRQPGEHVRDRAAFVIAALRADMMEARRRRRRRSPCTLLNRAAAGPVSRSGQFRSRPRSRTHVVQHRVARRNRDACR